VCAASSVSELLLLLLLLLLLDLMLLLLSCLLSPRTVSKAVGACSAELLPHCSSAFKYSIYLSAWLILI
jgi:hypothetical protein